MKLKSLSLLLFISACSMSDKERETLIQNIHTENASIVSRAAYKMGKSKDTLFVKYLMEGLDDPRISLSLGTYGMTVFCVKANALYKLHNVPPPYDLFSKIDTVVLNYWKGKYPQYYKPYSK